MSASDVLGRYDAISEIARGIGMTAKDAPYVLLIVLFMGITFMAGRYSVRVPSQPAQVPIATTAVSSATTTSRPVAEHDANTERVVPTQTLPPVITVEALPATSLAKAPPGVSGAKSPPQATAAPVVPMQIELEDDPTAIENPYKRKSATAR